MSFADDVRDAPDIGSTHGAIGDAKHEIERFGRGEGSGHGKQDAASADVDDIAVTPDGMAFGADTRRQRQGVSLRAVPVKSPAHPAASITGAD